MPLKNITIPVIVLSCLLIGACDEEPTFWLYDTIYSNSFETASDMEGWHEYWQFSDDVPPEGGTQSMIVAGGCSFPTIEYKLDAQPEDCYLKLRVWGKKLRMGGSVYLGHRNDHPHSISISVQDTVWTMYETPGDLFCPANEPLVIYIFSGGFAGGAILVDVLDVLRGKQ